MAVGRRRDAWERAARIIQAWSGEPIAEIMPDFGDDRPTQRGDVLPYNEALRAEIVKHYESGGNWSG